MIYIQLFYNFFITGLFSIGGGLATLPFLYDLSDKTGWFTHADLANMLAVSESTPGAIGINMSTYVGFEVASLPGGIIATLGLISPENPHHSCRGENTGKIQTKPLRAVGTLRSSRRLYRANLRGRTVCHPDISHPLQAYRRKRH